MTLSLFSMHRTTSVFADLSHFNMIVSQKSHRTIALKAFALSNWNLHKSRKSDF
jgi:hypothetical protein